MRHMKKATQRRLLNATFWTVWLLASTLVLAQIAMATGAAYPI